MSRNRMLPAATAALLAACALAGCSKKEEAKPATTKPPAAAPAPGAGANVPASTSSAAPSTPATPPPAEVTMGTPISPPPSDATVVKSNAGSPAEPVVQRANGVTTPAPGAGKQQPSEGLLVASVVFEAPKAWQKQQAATMRAAQFSIPAATPDGQPSEVAFFHFGRPGAGSVGDNLARWRSQVTGADGKPVEPEVESFEVGDLKVTQIIATGTYASGMPGGAVTPKTDYSLIGAVIEGGPDGAIFIRMTGPKDAVAAARPEWDALLRSARVPVK